MGAHGVQRWSLLLSHSSPYSKGNRKERVHNAFILYRLTDGHDQGLFIYSLLT